MRILKGEEAEKLPIVGGGRLSRIGAMVMLLEVGDALEILKTDWKGKNPLYNAINRVAKQTGRKFKKGRLLGGLGWGVRRIA